MNNDPQENLPIPSTDSEPPVLFNAKSIEAFSTMTSKLGWYCFPDRMEKTTRQREHTLAKVKKEVDEINNSYQTLSLAENAPEYAQHAILAKYNQDIKAFERRLSILEKVNDKFTEEEKEKLQSLQEDFSSRVYRLAEDCATEEAQERWANLIAGELRSPGSISLRSVRILNDMSSHEAKVLESFASISFSRAIFLRNAQDEDLEKIVLLADMNIVHSTMHSVTFDLLPNEHIGITRGANVIGDIGNLDTKPHTLKGYALTKFGRELMGLSQTLPNPELIMKNMNIASDALKWTFYSTNKE